MVHVCFFFNDTATTEIYTLSLHDALPIFEDSGVFSLNFLDTEQEDLARRFTEPLRHEDGQVGGSSYTTGKTGAPLFEEALDRKSTRLNSSHANISYAVFCLKKKNVSTSAH